MDIRTLVSTSVNDILRRVPAAAEVFNRFGIDLCCGSGLPLDQAAQNAGASLDDLVAALEPLARSTEAGTSA